METTTTQKWIDGNEYASKGVGNTALGLSIGALGLELLRNNNGLGGILNGLVGNNSQEQSSFSLYKGYRDADDAIIAQHNKDSFALYKNQRDQFDVLKGQIDALTTKLAVAEATQPWKDKAIYDAIALESERRCCNDGKIVNYSNLMFYPTQTADVTVGTTSTARIPFNPLCCGCNPMM